MAIKLMLATVVAMAVRTAPMVINSARKLVAAAPDDLELKSSPIEPSWVLAGDPQARKALHSRSHDDQAETVIWDCTAGTFNWHFGWEETVVILEGEVHVTETDGTERTLRAGDVAYFPARTEAIWHIETYVRKIAFARKEIPMPVSMAYRVRDVLRPSTEQRGLAA